VNLAGPIETFRGVVYPAQCDAMGHLNVKEYVGFFDQAEWHCYLALGFDARRISADRIGWAEARQSIEYERELRAGDLCRIESVVTKVGSKSLTTLHRMYDASSGALCAVFEGVSVQFDLERRAAIPLLDDVRNNAQAWLAASRPGEV
jgi:acyl-CoA thioester hydrolase